MRQFLLALSAMVALAAPLPLAAQLPVMPEAKDCRPVGFNFSDYKSVEQLDDGRVTFRICAPEATEVSVMSIDVDPPNFGNGFFKGLAMTKGERGMWSVTTPGPIPPNAYRYDFSIGGVRVPDPQATRFTQDRTGTHSLMVLKGPAADFLAWNKDVPHGAVSVVSYWSASLGMVRQAHVYTPPGYMKGKARYPVLYLVHGAGDSDDSWTGNGQAHVILDNLIAAGKARPMIVVMPFGHTPVRPEVNLLVNTDFGNDLHGDLIPFVESQFRTLHGPRNTAMAGLSMGGSHTLRFGLTRPDRFGYVGIFSMGFGLTRDPAEIPDYERLNHAALQQAAHDMRLVYYAMGKTDFLYATAAPTREVLNRNGIQHIYVESEGGHTWINWRNYLVDFAPRLFQN